MTPEAKKILFGSGPWVDEPDATGEIAECGLPIVILRNRYQGHLHGYIYIPFGHPFHGKHSTEIQYDLALPLSAHPPGGLNFAGRVEDIVASNMHEDAFKFQATIFRPWYVGFDAGTHEDYIPRHEKEMMAKMPVDLKERQGCALDDEIWGRYGGIYRDISYMFKYCRNIAHLIDAYDPDEQI